MSWEVSTMRCGMSFFNAAVYKNCLKRYWPVWGCLLLGLIFVLPLPVLNAGSDMNAEDMILSLGGYCGLSFGFVFSALAAMVVFSWMYQAKSAGFTGALPIKREAMFVSCALAGFTMLACPGVAAALLTLLAASGLCGFGAALALTGGWLAKYLLVCICFFGFACLCAHLTGSVWVVPLVYVLLNVAVVVFWYLIANVLNLLLPGFSGDVPLLAVDLSPVARMFTYNWSDFYFDGWLGLGCYAVFGLVCAFLGLLLAKKRRLESSGDTVALEWLKPVFRWVFALGFALCFANLLYLILLSDEGRHTALMGFFLVLGAFLGWIISEMLVRKSFKVASSLKTFPILAALLVLLMIFCATGGLGYSAWCPGVDEVKTASIDSYGYACVTDDPAEIEAICALHRGMAGVSTTDTSANVNVNYQLKNGRSVSRSYPLEALTLEAMEDFKTLLQRQLLGGLERMLTENGRSFSVSAQIYGGEEWQWFELSDEESRDLLRRCVLPDAEAGNIEMVSGWIFGGELDYGGEVCQLDIHSWLWESKEEGYYDHDSEEYMHISVTPAAKNTWSLLEQYRAASADLQPPET